MCIRDRLYTAVYNGDMLKSMRISEVSSEEFGTESEHTYTFEVPLTYSEDNTVRVYWWDTMQQPVADMLELIRTSETEDLEISGMSLWYDARKSISTF